MKHSAVSVLELLIESRLMYCDLRGMAIGLAYV